MTLWLPVVARCSLFFLLSFGVPSLSFYTVLILSLSFIRLPTVTLSLSSRSSSFFKTFFSPSVSSSSLFVQSSIFLFSLFEVEQVEHLSLSTLHTPVPRAVWRCLSWMWLCSCFVLVSFPLCLCISHCHFLQYSSEFLIFSSLVQNLQIRQLLKSETSFLIYKFLALVRKLFCIISKHHLPSCWKITM